MQDRREFYFDNIFFRTSPIFGRMIRAAYSEPQIRRHPSRRGGRYFFDTVVEQDKEEFEFVNVEEDVRRIAYEGSKKVVEKLENKLTEVFPFFDIEQKTQEILEEIDVDIDLDLDYRAEYYFYKQSSSVIIPVTGDLYYVVSRKKEDTKKTVEYLKSRFMEISGVTEDFGFGIRGLLSGRDYQERLLKSVDNVISVKYTEPKNDFEKEIIDAFHSFTDSFLSNANLYFEKPTENVEYDIFMGFTPWNKLIIEPTNYETLKQKIAEGEKLKSSLIRDMTDKSLRIGAEVIVIAKDVPTKTFSDIKEIADSRGVLLLNEENYKDAICDRVLDSLFFCKKYPGD